MAWEAFGGGVLCQGGSVLDQLRIVPAQQLARGEGRSSPFPRLLLSTPSQPRRASLVPVDGHGRQVNGDGEAGGLLQEAVPVFSVGM